MELRRRRRREKFVAVVIVDESRPFPELERFLPSVSNLSSMDAATGTNRPGPSQRR